MPPLRILLLEDEYPAAERLQRLLALAAPTARCWPCSIPWPARWPGSTNTPRPTSS
ncbi:MAG: hypothetical protein WKG07_14965 [Hymenobacter sp.]